MFMYSLRRVALSATSGVCQHHRLVWACAAQQTITPRSSRHFATSQALAKRRTKSLKILFCGSDPFSCASLQALHEEQLKNKRLVKQIEVMVMPGKKIGRGLRGTARVPCKELAEELGLKIHERPSFENWKLPRGFNLVVAVSFGLFVPPRILSAAKYGGLNIHPSLLPDLRGPAPIHRALLRGDPFTGISLQTLSPEAFDHGTVLAQTPAPGIPLDHSRPFSVVRRDLAAHGATMLIEGLRAGLHVPPHDDAGWWAAAQGGDNKALVHAPKTSKADQEVDWKTWSADDLLRHMAVFNTVWTRGVVQGTGKRAGQPRRVIFTKAKAASPDEVAGLRTEQLATLMHSSGVKYEILVKVDEATGNCYFPLADGTWICVTNAKMEGTNEREAMSALRKIFRVPDQPFCAPRCGFDMESSTGAPAVHNINGALREETFERKLDWGDAREDSQSEQMCPQIETDISSHMLEVVYLIVYQEFVMASCAIGPLGADAPLPLLFSNPPDIGIFKLSSRV